MEISRTMSPNFQNGTMNGYDIAPDEIRTHSGRTRQVDAILRIGHISNEGYSTYTSSVIIPTRPGQLFEEPMDESESGPEVEAEIEYDESYQLAKSRALLFLATTETDNTESQTSEERQHLSDSDSETSTRRYYRDYTKYYSERERLKTFQHWPQSYHVTHLDLAKGGFIYRGPGDRVVCVFCRKRVHKWDEGDDVASEHRCISPKCPFVLGQCYQLNEPISQDRTLRESFRVIPKTQCDEAKYPPFEDVQLRQETFINWPSDNKITVMPLISAGFFFTGRGDCVTCFHCGKSVDQWSVPDDPWERHANLNPSCPLVVHHKGQSVTPSKKSKLCQIV